MLGDLEREIERVKLEAAKRKREEVRVEKQVKAVMEGEGGRGNVLGISRGGHNTRGAGRAVQDDDEDDAMEVDGGMGAAGGGKKRTAGGGGGGGIGGFMGRFAGGRSSGR